MQERALELWDYYGDVDCQSVEPEVVDKPSVVSLPISAANAFNACPKRYRAYFRHVTDKDKSEFKCGRCVVPISMGRLNYHEGAQFAALLRLLNESFASCTIVVVDLLYRYSLEIEHPNKTEAERVAQAICMGKEWMLRNGVYISQLTISHKITYWNDWAMHPNFQTYKSKVEALYANDEVYKNNCDSVVNQFMSRAEHRLHNREFYFEASLKYVIEESAAFCLWADAGCSFEAYPGTKIGKMVDLTYVSTKLNVAQKCRSLLVAIEKR